MTDKTIPLIAGMVILLGIVGTLYSINNIDQTYYCEKANTVSMCFKLNNPVNGISSRCYYNETIPTRYFTCASGWKNIKNFPDIMNNLTITGNEIIEKSYDEIATNDMSSFIKQDMNPKYGVITITSSTKGKLAEYSLISTKEDIIDIAMYGKATLYLNGTLFNDTNYLNKIGKNINGSGRYFIQVTKDNYVDVPDTFKQQCDLIKGDVINGTNDTQYCYNVTATTKTVNHPITFWELYVGQILLDGDYNWKWEGKRNINQIIDVEPVAYGQALTDWIWFNSSFNYEQVLTNMTGNVSTWTLPYNAHMASDFSDVRFVSSDDSIALNYSIESYSAGAWAIVYVANDGSADATTVHMYYGNTTTVSTTGNMTNIWGNNIRAYYPLNEQSGTAVYDRINGYNGVVNGAHLPVKNFGGAFNNSYNFTGSSMAYLNNVGLDLWNKFTITFWVNYKNGNPQGSPLTRNGGSTSSIQYHMDVRTTNVVNTVVGTNNPGMDTTTNTNNSQWHQLIIQGNGTDQLVYADGVLKNSGNGATTYGQNRYSGNTTLGNRDNLGGSYYYGAIDEVAFYNSTLTSDQVYRQYNMKQSNPIYGGEQKNGCTFSGYVKDTNSNALSGANIIIFNQGNLSSIYNTTSDVNGAWNITSVNSGYNYTAVAYYNNTLIGQAKPYIVC